MQQNTGLLLINLGTPTSSRPAAIRSFLRQFLSDKRVVQLSHWLWLPILYLFILPLRPRVVARSYRKIWQDEGSPLMVYTHRLAKKIAARCQLPTEVGMCYQFPSIQGALYKLQQQGVNHIIVLPLYPQFSNTTTSAALDQINATLKKQKKPPTLSIIEDYHDHPAYIDALSRHTKSHHSDNSLMLFSFHGIPQRYADQGDPYPQQCEQTSQRLANAMRLSPQDWKLVYQSRFGKAPWLTPYCDQVLAALPAKGVRQVTVTCPGFAVDCLETLEEIKRQYRDVYLNAGGTYYHFIPCMNDSDDHAAALSKIALEALTADA